MAIITNIHFDDNSNRPGTLTIDYAVEAGTLNTKISMELWHKIKTGRTEETDWLRLYGDFDFIPNDTIGSVNFDLNIDKTNVFSQKVSFKARLSATSDWKESVYFDVR